MPVAAASCSLPLPPRAIPVFPHPAERAESFDPCTRVNTPRGIYRRPEFARSDKPNDLLGDASHRVSSSKEESRA